MHVRTCMCVFVCVCLCVYVTHDITDKEKRYSKKGDMCKRRSKSASEIKAHLKIEAPSKYLVLRWREEV